MTKLTVVPGTAAGPLATLVEDYLTSCKARGLSPNTLENSYGYPLRKVLLPFCEAEGIKEPGALTSRALDRLAAQLMYDGGPRGPLSRHSVHAYMRAINHFLAGRRRRGSPCWRRRSSPACRRRSWRCSPATRSRRWRTWPGPSVTSSSSGHWPTRASGWGSWRGCGPPTSSRRAASITCASEGRVQGTPGALSPGSTVGSAATPTGAGPTDAVTDRLFVSLKRRPESLVGAYEPLTESGVQQLVRNLARSVGIERRVYPHLLRHSYITWAIRRGMHPVQIRQIVGHESTAMIDRVYSHLVPQDAYAATMKLLADEGD